MDDNQPVTRYEFQREIARLDKKGDRAHERIDDLAKDAVTVSALDHVISDVRRDQTEYEARTREARAEDQATNREQHAALRESIANVRDGATNAIKEWMARAQSTRGERIAIAGIIVTALTALIAAYITSHH